jgi:hypothetical protein
MTAQRRVVAEDYILHNRLPRPDRLEKFPEVRPEIIIIISIEGHCLRSRFFAGRRVVLLVPLLNVRIP